METVAVEQVSTYQIVKADDDLRIAYGWASVITEDGKDVIDTQGDIIDERTMLEAAHDFMLDARAGKLMHQGLPVADVVESVVFTEPLQEALGINLGKVGWFIGMKVWDDKLWQRVKAGEFPAFSIGGEGERVEVQVAPTA